MIPFKSILILPFLPFRSLLGLIIVSNALTFCLTVYYYEDIQYTLESSIGEVSNAVNRR